MSLVCLSFHRGTAGNPARYNTESLDFFEETADYADLAVRTVEAAVSAALHLHAGGTPPATAVTSAAPIRFSSV
jgi:hypothetical protein